MRIGLFFKNDASPCFRVSLKTSFYFLKVWIRLPVTGRLSYIKYNKDSSVPILTDNQDNVRYIPFLRMRPTSWRGSSGHSFMWCSPKLCCKGVTLFRKGRWRLINNFTFARQSGICSNPESYILMTVISPWQQFAVNLFCWHFFSGGIYDGLLYFFIHWKREMQQTFTNYIVLEDFNVALFSVKLSKSLWW